MPRKREMEAIKMSIDKLKRIVWRLREANDTKQYHLKEVRLAIMNEVGLSERTIKKYIKILKEAGQLQRLGRWQFKDIAGLL